MNNPKVVNNGEMRGQSEDERNRKQANKTKFLIAMLIFTWNIIGINNSIKCQRLPGWRKKKSKIQIYAVDRKHMLNIRTNKNISLNMKRLTEES